MFPIYQGMNAYPYQKNQMPSSTYYHPSWESVPSQMKETPPSSSCTHESWPHNYGYPVPTQCHNCCSHGQHPAYYDFRPPCSHFRPPPPPPAYNQFYGGFPHSQSSYPMYYAPPPHYPIDLSRSEYDKSAPRDEFHCCGCPNHSCHAKGRNNVKIEEQEPDVETKKSEPLFPAGAKNFSYPIVWVPPGFTMNKEQPRRLVENDENEQQVLPFVKKSQMPRKSIESQVQDNQGSPLGKKPQGSVPENGDPNLGYGWFPLDMNSIKQLMEGGDVRKTLNQEKISGGEKTAQDVWNKDQNKQLSCPIMWVPYDKLLKDNSEGQVENTGGKSVDESAATSSVSPGNIEHAVNEEGKGRTKPGSGDGKTSTLGAEKKSSIVRTIPVKQIEESAPKLPRKEEERKPSSPTKKPKLPPICLRVDPPKKKNGNRSSRSPSPPGDKKCLDPDVSRSGVKNEHLQGEIKVKDAEEKTSHENEIKVSHSASEAGGVEKKIVQHDNISKGDVKCGDAEVQTRESQASEAGDVEIKALQPDNSSKSGDSQCGDDQVQARESQATKESEAEPEGLQKRNVMSEMEAAVIIQSAYRGFYVRRWEPLKKLKLIGKVCEEAIQVKKNIEDLDSRDDVIDDKVKTIIGETIMKLLLKLDTVQGLHESIRDVRRSLAKELTLLQEKLDSMMNRKLKNTSTMQASEATPKDIALVEASEGTAETTEDLSIGSSPDEVTSTHISEGDLNDSFSNQHLPCHNEVCGSGNKVTEEPLPLNMKSPKETQESRDGDVSAVEETTVQSHLVAENRDQKACMFPELPQEVIEMSPAAMGTVEGVVKENDLLSGNQDHEVSQPLEPPEQANEQSLAKTRTVEDASKRENDTVFRPEDQEPNILSELPRKVVEDEKEMPLDELVMESPDRIKDQEADILSELPREVVEEDEKEMPLAEIVMESPDRIDQEAGLFSELPLEVVEDKKGMPLAETESSGKLNDVHQHDERCKLANEEGLVISHDNNPLEISVEETQTSLEAENIGNLANFDIPITVEEAGKLKETTGEREAEEPQNENEVEGMKQSKETSNAEFSSKTTTLTGPSQGGSNDTTGVLDDNHETESETLNREISNMESSFTTSPLLDPISNIEPVPELSASDHQHEFKTQDLPGETLVTEPAVQQSKSVEFVEQQAGQLSEVQSSVTAGEKEVQAEAKVKEENEKLRKLLEKLLESGKEQQEFISNLNGKVKDLEKKLAKRKTKSGKHTRVKVVRSSCGKPANGSLSERQMGAAS